jgi:phytoene synthase
MTAVASKAIEYCQQVTKESGTSFYWAFQLMPSPKREAMWALYAFCRYLDDIVDDDDHQERNPLALLDAWRGALADCYKGSPTHPITIALSKFIALFNLPRQPFEDLIDGVGKDLLQQRYKTFEELKGYCYGVASTVGLLSIEIFGYTNPLARNYAVLMGQSLQMINILRDVGEDIARGRIYLPAEDMHLFGVTEDDLRLRVPTPGFVALMRYECGRARDLLRQTDDVLPPEDLRSLYPAEMMAAVYRHLLTRIEANPAAVLNGPLSVADMYKLILAARAWLRCRAEA